jgi:hypothetical protein
LVTIVVFLVGILAVARIFPGGLRILQGTARRTQAVALGNSTLESLVSRSDLIPEAVVPITYQLVGATYQPIVDVNRLPTDYSPAVTGITTTGVAVEAARDWHLVSGANVTRRILGETHEVPASRSLSPDGSPTAVYGNLLTFEFGPMDHNLGQPVNNAALQVYGRDMYRRDVSAGTNNLAEYEFVTEALDSTNARIYLPAQTAGVFRVAFSAYVQNGVTTTLKNFAGIPVAVPVDPSGIYTLNLASLMAVGDTLRGVTTNSLRVARSFRLLAPADAWDPAEPFTYKLYNGRLGQLLINPVLAGRYEERAGSERRPYVVRVDYDVRDWRVLHYDFRWTPDPPSSIARIVQLPITSLKTNTVLDNDGRAIMSHAQVLASSDNPYAGMEDVYVVNNTTVASANTTELDNFLLVDLDSGAQYLEQYNGAPTVRLDKTSGRLTLTDIDNNPANGLTQALAMPDGTVVLADVRGRGVRTYFMGKDDWAVQVTRNAASYVFAISTPGVGEFYVGGTVPALNGLATRIYFPRMDADKLVTFGKIRYIWDDAGTPREGTLEGAEFRIQFRTGADTIAQPLPSIDIREKVPSATGFVLDSGPESAAYAVSDVSGVSMQAKVFINNAAMTLNDTPANNLTKSFQYWANQWSIVKKETYLHRGNSIR